ncbi:MAG: hypothetical protein JXO44_15375 [Clostridia bacterium]|nr:hypothetical protein [Clostridia bacterium]
MKNPKSKLINNYSTGVHSGSLTNAVLIADDLAHQGYKVLLLISDPEKMKRVLESFNQEIFLSGGKETDLQELFMLLESGKMTDERLILYAKKMSTRSLHLIGAMDVDQVAQIDRIFPITGEYDFVFNVSDAHLAFADMNVRTETQDALVRLLEKDRTMLADLMIIGQYKSYKHLSLKKMKRWLGDIPAFTVSQSEDVNRAYHRSNLLMKNYDVDREIDLIAKYIRSQAVIK